MAATTYHARAERGAEFWLVHVSEVDRWTQARTYGEIDAVARDLIAVMDEVEPDSFELEVEMTYRVVAKPWTHGWELHIDELGVTQCGSLADAERMAREYISTVLDVDEYSFNVAIAEPE